MEEDNGRLKALNVTGPGGTPVKGAARRTYPGFGDGGGGGGGGFNNSYGDNSDDNNKY